MSREPGSAIAHVPALDGLRGIAILLVVCLHFGVRAGFPGPHMSTVGGAIERVMYVGWAGVDLFFVLSGFLISSVLLASKPEPRYFANFYGRRVLRIFPLYFGTLILGLLVLPRLVSVPPAFLGAARAHSIWLWTYTSNIALSFAFVVSFGAFDLYWSLAIEEQFYLVWPLIVKITSPRRLALVCIGVVLFSLVFRILWVALGADWWGAYRFTLTRIDQLAMGALVALIVRDDAVRARAMRVAPLVLVFATVLFAGLFAQINPFYPSSDIVVTFGHTLVAVIFACLVLISVCTPEGRLGRALSARWLRAWGKVSYGVYVWHWPLWLVLDLWYRDVPPAKSTVRQLGQAAGFLGAGLAGAFVLGWLSFHLFEKHFLSLKRRFAYRSA